MSTVSPIKVICFDLDHTLCTPVEGFERSEIKYGQATPIPETIEWLREQKASGAVVIIHTARRMRTHKGDVQAVERDVGQLTREWLAIHQVPYDELVFGKPNADIYIDDKGAHPSLVIPKYRTQ